MAITKRSVNTANDPKLGPIFQFKTYSRDNSPFYNNPSQIDFVTYNGSLYVCVENGTTYRNGNPTDNGFLLLVAKGSDGRPGVDGKEGPMGPMPNYNLKFDGKQLVIIDQNGVRKAVSPELTGPSWFPELHEHTIVWKRKEPDELGTPQDINLDELRPIEEHPVLFRLNSDNTKREAEETGPGYYIQWKREGNEEWTNLMSISELMNIALAGVSFWWADAKDGSTDIEGNPTQTLHFGHRQVQKATYDSSKLGNSRIADVVLGDVLFDAGEVPFKNYDDDVAALHTYICNLQQQVDNIVIPTRLSAFINDVPYVKTINTNAPNTAGEIKVKRIDGIEIVGDEGNVPFKTVAGQRIIRTSEQDPTNIDVYTKTEANQTFLTSNNIKTLAGVSLVKGADATGPAADVPLKTVGGQSIIGNGNIDLGDLDLNGVVKSVSVNGGTHVTPDPSGNVNLTVSGGSGSGISNIGLNLRIDSSTNKLQYQLIIDGEPQSWQNGPVLPSGGSGGSTIDNIEFTIDNGHLKYRITINNNLGSWVDAGAIPTGSGNGSVVYIQQILSSGTKIATITIDGTPVDIYAPSNGGGTNPGGDTPSGTVITYNTFLVYQRTNSNTQAPSTNTITAATWNVSTNELTLTSQYWTNHPGNATGDNDKYLWMTCATFRSDTGARVGNWSDPVCLTSRDAEAGDGNDSNHREFIYRSVTAAEYPVVVAVRPVKAQNNNDDDNFPPSDNLAVRQWGDHPVGISQEYPYELCSYRRKENGNWGEYSMPFIWSRWGEDGVDGDGIEYVYRLATVSEVEESNGSIVLKQSVARPSNSWTEDSPIAPWTDDPSGVNASTPYEFCSMRKTTTNIHTWGNWSEPALWANYVSVDANIDYQQIEATVLAAIQSDLNSLDTRLDSIEGNYAITTLDSENGLFSAVTGYKDANQTSFADLIVNAAAAKINANVGAAIWGPNSEKTLTNVKTELDAVSATATTAATQAIAGAINDARTEWSGADASITSTATRARYVWVAADGSLLEYTAEDVTNNVASKTVSGVTYTRTLVADAMSAIQQQADKISLVVGNNKLVGEDGALRASIVVSAINDSNVTIDANKINLNGYVTATELSTGSVTIAPSSIDNGYIGGSNGIHITANGITLGSGCTISWDNIDSETIPDLGGSGSGSGLDQSDVESIIDSYVDSTFLTTTIGSTYVETNDLFIINGNAKKINAQYIDVADLNISNSVTIGDVTYTAQDAATIANLITTGGGVLGNTAIWIGSAANCPYNDALIFTT